MQSYGQYHWKAITIKNEHKHDIVPGQLQTKQILGQMKEIARTEQNPINNIRIATSLLIKQLKVGIWAFFKATIAAFGLFWRSYQSKLLTMLTWFRPACFLYAQLGTTNSALKWAFFIKIGFKVIIVSITIGYIGVGCYCIGYFGIG